MEMEKRFLGIKELSAYLGIAEGTAYVWVCHRKIPFVKVGRLVKFDVRKIDAWVQENSVEVMD
jgi:excisionase family DNA binding protein